MTSTSKPQRSRKPQRSSKPSIKYNGCPVDGASFELADITDKDCSPSSSNKNRKNHKKSEHKSSGILTTPELVSKVGKVWDIATRPLSFFQPRTTPRHNRSESTEANLLFHYEERRDIGSSLSSESDNQYLAVNPITIEREDLHHLKVYHKISSFGPRSWKFVHPLLKDSSSSKDESPSALDISYVLRERYRWMWELSDPELEQKVDSQLAENQKIDYEPTSKNILGIPISEISEDDHVFEEGQVNDDDVNLCASEIRQENGVLVTSESENGAVSPKNSKSDYGLAKQEHAFAGALAGLSVSLCLHPIDTVKTVIQTCRADQKSINYIGRSIISERGLTGLYRGIATNIASSAPISAVYAFTYESVKGVLLPLLPMKYQSLAHCTAGGCASIATSFIFTPSERVKQQMQVNSHYSNCWNAIVGITRTGGLSSLYVGWGAVLCRNVPHSIIKFYTYEKLKNLTPSSHKSNGHPNTSQTLICGGLAGSTAALFTTPFDVVKTRLQTQIPGSIWKYDGVLNTLMSIGKNEGLKGLYRGLIPRLFMYVSQGAIFFGSYESFKRLFFLEVPHLYAPTTKHTHTMEDEAS